jgi:hypothetical protein
MRKEKLMMCRVICMTYRSRAKRGMEDSKPLLITEDNLYYLIVALISLKHMFIYISSATTYVHITPL